MTSTSRSRAVARLAYRDPEHLPERLALYAAFVYLLAAILAVLRARGDHIATAADVGPDEVHESKEEP